MRSHRVVVFGDSIAWGACDSQGGWVHRLKVDICNQKDLDYSLYNCGVDGDTTQSLLKRFKIEHTARYYPYNDEHIVIFAIGLNDSVSINTKGNFTVPLHEFKENIKELITQAQKLSTRIIIVGITPVDESKTTPVEWDHTIFCYMNHVKLYNSTLKEIAQEHNIEFIEILQTISTEDLSDGVHPNDRGHQKMYVKVKEHLLKTNSP